MERFLSLDHNIFTENYYLSETNRRQPVTPISHNIHYFRLLRLCQHMRWSVSDAKYFGNYIDLLTYWPESSTWRWWIEQVHNNSSVSTGGGWEDFVWSPRSWSPPRSRTARSRCRGPPCPWSDGRGLRGLVPTQGWGRTDSRTQRSSPPPPSRPRRRASRPPSRSGPVTGRHWLDDRWNKYSVKKL